ncbi:hypothetical protein EOPP23_11200 [Endozoicomonas sp. OPT23]|uniref:hypothetical protein n=1 Tax=Endozoicomonas sp. OPT23 TaxID=2072845 RepID=UPI00129AD42F|nr:hypothetical protein [Endozoicomonas sp. OPT23]MRI33552.1 hypothetical protein [Endozoicomonas sp. OPT23]
MYQSKKHININIIGTVLLLFLSHHSSVSIAQPPQTALLDDSATYNVSPFHYDHSTGRTILVVDDSNGQSLLDALKHPEHYPIKLIGTYPLNLSSDLIVTKLVFSESDPECKLTQAFGLDQFKKLSVHDQETDTTELTTTELLSDKCPSAVILNQGKSELIVGSDGSFDNIGFIDKNHPLQYQVSAMELIDIALPGHQTNNILLGEDVALMQRGGGGKGGSKGKKGGASGTTPPRKNSPPTVPPGATPGKGPLTAADGEEDPHRKGKAKGNSKLDTLIGIFQNSAKQPKSNAHKQIFIDAFNSASDSVKTQFKTMYGSDPYFKSFGKKLL